MVATASTTVPIAHTIYTIPTTIELFFARLDADPNLLLLMQKKVIKR